MPEMDFRAAVGHPNLRREEDDIDRVGLEERGGEGVEAPRPLRGGHMRRVGRHQRGVGGDPQLPENRLRGYVLAKNHLRHQQRRRHRREWRYRLISR